MSGNKSYIKVYNKYLYEDREDSIPCYYMFSSLNLLLKDKERDGEVIYEVKRVPNQVLLDEKAKQDRKELQTQIEEKQRKLRILEAELKELKKNQK